MKKTYHQVDLLVVGGGVSGTVAAIAAARRGLKTVLLHNRPVLGGPSSSECSCNSDGACVNGAHEYVNRNARECGIIEEMKQEAFFRKANGWEQHWSLVMREWAEREPNLTLLLNTEAYEVIMNDDKIKSVTARTIGSEITHHITAEIFIDCSGDSFIGAAAGADCRMGREGRDEFGESLAPPQPDEKTMGSSIAFRAIDMGRPVAFKAPEWAYKINGDEDLPYRIHNNPNQGYWWLEYGGELDTITDNEEIYRKLLSILFGVWDHVKNDGDHGAANYAINWISAIPGKRESRRLIGDYILTQNDVINHPDFPDTVAYGGWPIDLHPPEGFFSNGHPGSPPPFTFPGLYPIPFRCLYSRNITNLMMGGRNISVSHVALGTTRLMATCAVCGQAIGAAAVLACKYHVSPREVGQKYITELQYMLAEDDSLLPIQSTPVYGIPARISASSELVLTMQAPTGEDPLLPPDKTHNDDPCDVSPEDRRRVQYFIASGEYLETVKILFDSPARFEAGLYDTEHRLVAKAPALFTGDIAEFHFKANLIVGKKYYLQLPEIQGISVKLSQRYLPGLERKLDGCYLNNDNWCFETVPPLQLYPAANAINGLARPSSECSNMWISAPGMPQWLELDFGQERTISQVELIFDTNLDISCYNGVAKECVKDYRLEILQAGQWQIIEQISGNYQRRRHHEFNPVSTSGIRLVVTATNGDESARVYEFRAK